MDTQSGCLPALIALLLGLLLLSPAGMSEGMSEPAVLVSPAPTLAP